MKNEKNIEYNNLTGEEIVKKLAEERDKILNEFAKAYLAETKLLPSEVELVTVQNPPENGIIETVYYFRKKT